MLSKCCAEQICSFYLHVQSLLHGEMALRTKLPPDLTALLWLQQHNLGGEARPL